MRADRHGDLAGHEGLPTAGRLVVEQDPVARRRARSPRGSCGSSSTRRAWPRRTATAGRTRWPRPAAAGSRRTSRRSTPGSSGRAPPHPDRLQQPGGPQAGDVAGELGLVEGDADVGLRGQVVDLVRGDPLQQRDQPGPVGQVAVVQEQPGVRVVPVACSRWSIRLVLNVTSAGGSRGPRSPCPAAARPGTTRPGR